jgi:XTP/dITP diphosphohydrolase
VTRAVVVATRNRGKLHELNDLVRGLPYEFRALSDFPGAPEVEETGATFLENATLKALSAFRHTGLPALADDSGLCVVALGGGPGVHSSRYGGVEGDAARNNATLLAALADVAAPGERRAWFQATLALVGPPDAIGGDDGPGRPAFLPAELGLRVFEGRAYGTILTAPRGAGGFGYDPLFRSEDAGVSFAELPLAEKNRISHRARAFAGLRAHLVALAGG